MMQSHIAINAVGLGKKYSISHRAKDRSDTLRDALTLGTRRMARSMADMLRGRQIHGGDEVEEFWALKDLDFEIAQGDVVGIVGRNGAGKSTLLKVLSRITEPSVGRVAMRGRVSSLLEVGTGFHPELTGRENIFLNGAILGMSRAEVSRKFDEIVAFAGVERFLDTPVKRYSSGMYVRLAFAVAANMEPDILVVDEVLAVGDADFQSRCLGKLQDVSSEGRTVLFVSHNPSALRRLCTSGMLLSEGRAVFRGTIEDTLDQYSKLIGSSDGGNLGYWSGAASSDPSFTLVETLVRGSKSGKAIVHPAEDIELTFAFRQRAHFRASRLVFALMNDEGEMIFQDTDEEMRLEADANAINYVARCTIPGNILNSGYHTVRVAASIPQQTYLLEPTEICQFLVSANGAGAIELESKWPGVIRPRLRWELRPGCPEEQ